MKASRVHRFGSPEVIVVEDVPRPEPGPFEVLVRVSAAGVGPWDAAVRAGKSVLPQPLPLTLGADLAGRVAALGDGVTDVAVGDAVFGVTNPRFTGAYAEYAVAAAGRLARAPAGLDAIDAASLPVIGITALQMLFDHAHVQSGQRVLVHGAGGNVGACVVQLAALAGAYVIGTDVAPEVEQLRALGASEVLDTATTRFEDAVERVDVVIDTVGGDVQRRSFSVLERGGTMVSSVCAPDREQALQRGVVASFMLVNVSSAALYQLSELLGAGKLKARVGAILPLAEARVAHEMLEGVRPRPRGKIVLRVG
jgi:NADPH:quinone reductase-like Zn-dependent oxidoreductase